MATTIAIWLGTCLMVLHGKLHGRELLYALSAAAVSTLAVWYKR